MEQEVKVIKVVQDPRISLKQFSRYNKATEKGKENILKGSKYPSGYVPRFYEKARKVVCDTLGANFDDYELYFDQFTRQAAILRKEAMEFPSDKDEYKNRISSANGLMAFVAMGKQIVPMLRKYVLNSNLSNRRDASQIEGVKIGAVADMLLFEDAGASQVGLLKFNFTKEPMSRLEAEYMLYVLRKFANDKYGIKVELKDCILVDVFSSKIFIATDDVFIEEPARLACLDIKGRWAGI